MCITLHYLHVHYITLSTCALPGGARGHRGGRGRGEAGQPRRAGILLASEFSTRDNICILQKLAFA